MDRRRTALVVTGLLFMMVISSVTPVALDSDTRTAHDDPGTRSAEDGPGRKWFYDVTIQKGLNYTGVRQQPGVRGDMSNAGVYVADYNNDLWSDLLVIGGHRPILYVNRHGSFTRSHALPPIDGYVRTALFFDYDGDGWSDLLLLRRHAVPLLLRNDHGEFRAANAGFEKPLRNPIGAATADYDGDGCLDLFVIQNGNWSATRPERLGNGTPVEEDNGAPNILYKGTCGSFVRVDRAGISGHHWSLATSFVDLTGDGRPDIHVANDFYFDTLYVNRGEGRFERRELNRTNRNAMASEAFDANGDGRVDLFVTNIHWTRNAKAVLGRVGYAIGSRQGNNLLINTGSGTFTDKAREYTVLRGRWGWAVAAGDFDNDMDIDLFHTTRAEFVRVPMVRNNTRLYSFRQPRFFENTGTGFVPRDAPALGFQQTDGRGTAQLDFDNDGDVDLVVADTTGQFKLYENRGFGNHSLQVIVRAEDGSPAIGARVFVTVDGHTQLRVLNSRSDYLSQSSRVLHFGADEHESIDRVTIIWADGRTRILTDIRTEQQIIVSPEGIVRSIRFDSYDT